MGNGYAGKGFRVACCSHAIGVAGSIHCLFIGDADKGVVLPIKALNALQKILGEFDTGVLAFGQPLAELGNGFIVHWGYILKSL